MCNSFTDPQLQLLINNKITFFNNKITYLNIT